MHYNILFATFEVFTAVTMKNCVFLDVTTCGSLRTVVSEELSAFFITATRIGELGTLAVTSNRCTLRSGISLLLASVASCSLYCF
jgi:hypothetical protein